MIGPTACPGPRGAWLPVVDPTRCEAKGPCVDACPYDVLDRRRINDLEWASFGLLAKLKSTAHGRRIAFAVDPDRCRGCGRCADVCPEQAIEVRLRT